MNRLTRSVSIAVPCGNATLAWAQPQNTSLRGSVTSLDGKTVVVAARVKVNTNGVKPTP